MYYVGKDCKATKKLPKCWYREIGKIKVKKSTIHVLLELPYNKLYLSEEENWYCIAVTEKELKQDYKTMPQNLIVQAEEEINKVLDIFINLRECGDYK